MSKDPHDRVQDLYRELANLHNEGYRCRYDPELLKQHPLPEGMELIERHMCYRCGYEDRHADSFCQKYLAVWGTLAKIDPGKYGPGGTEV